VVIGKEKTYYEVIAGLVPFLVLAEHIRSLPLLLAAARCIINTIKSWVAQSPIVSLVSSLSVRCLRAHKITAAFS
jgi:hypothetical protein